MKPATIIGVVFMFISTILLYFGLTATLLTWKVSLEIFGIPVRIFNEHRDFPSLIKTMWDDSMVVPVILLFFFGFCLPVIKLVLFILWAVQGGVVSGGEKYIGLVRGLSKWTGVDAILECIIVGMLLKVPGTVGAHSTGFLCFALYVPISTAAFYFLPGEEPGDDAPNALHLKVVERFRSARVRKVTLIGLLATFLLVLSAGLTEHSIRIGIPKDIVQYHIGKRLGIDRDSLPAPLRQLSDPAMRRIEEAVANTVSLSADTSIAGCARRLYQSPSPHSIWGSTVIFLLVVFVPVAYAVINTAYSLAYTELPEEELKAMTDASSRGDHENAAPWPQINRMRHFLWEISMLDVAAVAFVIMVPSLGTAHEAKLEGDLLEGYFLLVLATVLWHTLNLCCRAAQLSVLDSEDIQGLVEHQAASSARPVAADPVPKAAAFT